MRSLFHHSLAAGALAAGAFACSAFAADTMPTAMSAMPASRIKISGHIEAGITANPASPADHQNFGRLFDDRSNEPLLNQFILTAEQTLDPKATGFDWGFKLQGMYGSDARFIHSVGLLDHSTNRILQPDLVEAYLNLHLPTLTAGGIDVKVGKFVTLEGAEVIDSTGNLFYSHSYLFNFGIPLNHTGVLATIHATSDLDLMVGVTRGVNTSLTDNNGALAFHGGVSLPTAFGNKDLAVVFTTHVGPETPHDNKHYRYLNDLVAIYKINDKLTSTSDLNYIYDAAAKAKGYGAAQYFAYVVSDTVTAGFRGEIWRDQSGFYVAQFGNNTDYLNFERGVAFTPDARTVGGGATTYGALTFGATVKTAIAGLVIRPEVRWDTSLNGTRPFNDSKDKQMLTFAVDATWSF